MADVSVCPSCVLRWFAWLSLRFRRKQCWKCDPAFIWFWINNNRWHPNQRFRLFWENEDSVSARPLTKIENKETGRCLILLGIVPVKMFPFLKKKNTSCWYFLIYSNTFLSFKYFIRTEKHLCNFKWCEETLELVNCIHFVASQSVGNLS